MNMKGLFPGWCVTPLKKTCGGYKATAFFKGGTEWWLFRDCFGSGVDKTATIRKLQSILLADGYANMQLTPINTWVNNPAHDESTVLAPAVDIRDDTAWNFWRYGK